LDSFFSATFFSVTFFSAGFFSAFFSVTFSSTGFTSAAFSSTFFSQQESKLLGLVEASAVPLRSRVDLFWGVVRCSHT
jgi:hypothetical protein